MKKMNQKLSIMFLFSLYSIMSAAFLKDRTNLPGTGFFIIRSEWDDKCVAFMKNDLVLDENCNLSQSIWESTNGRTSNVTLRNYYSGKFLSFVNGNPRPLMLDEPSGNSRFDIQFVHSKNKRWIDDKKYWQVNYYVIKNISTKLCLMLNGDFMRQLKCDPNRPEHLSFESVPLNPKWVKSPDRIVYEKKKNSLLTSSNGSSPLPEGPALTPVPEVVPISSLPTVLEKFTRSPIIKNPCEKFVKN